MTTTQTQDTPPTRQPRRGPPRWAWVLITTVVVLALVVAAVLVYADRGRTTLSPQAQPAPLAPAPGNGPGGTLADGCLGGRTDLDQAMLTAQKQAPLTAAGAAAYAATLIRWSIDLPAPANQKATAQQILSTDATPAALHSLSSSADPQGWTRTVSSAAGSFYIESFDGTSAAVSLRVGGTGTKDGVAVEPGILGGTMELEAVGGLWRYRDKTYGRNLDDMDRLGTPYAGGC
jgi:hypothetical protein